MADVECVVIGAGVLGLAVARALAVDGCEVLLVEAAEGIGAGISSRNSEVIHAGLYYRPGSLKARLCVEGREMLYAYCVARGISHRRVGKLVLATTPEQVARLVDIEQRAHLNGVDDLYWLSGAQVQDLEPALECVRALVSPSTGIVDSHALMLSLHADAESAGTQCAFRTPFERGQVLSDAEFLLEFGGADPISLSAGMLVNAAGLNAPSVARLVAGLEPGHVPCAYLCRGSYFSLSGKSPFSHLVYPVPGEAGLGVHFTLDLAGRGRFGPDVEWVEVENYCVDPKRSQSFYTAVRKYWPTMPDGVLVPDYCGIRPKIVAAGTPAADFMVSGPTDHGVPGLVNLLGIESPGLTASLGIAEYVRSLLRGSAIK